MAYSSLRGLGVLILAFGLLAVAAGEAEANRRIALLIGNAAYPAGVGPLVNPVNDIDLLGQALKRVGFEVQRVENATLGAMHSAIGGYTRRLRRAGDGAVGFFYYSGHGAQEADTGTNYLIPVDVPSVRDTDLWDRSLRITSVTRQLKEQAANATHLVVLDACRNALRVQKVGTKSLLATKGFTPVPKVAGMLVAYATAAGETASDVGRGAGPYARALAEELVRPGVEVVSMFRNVQVRVYEQSQQEPWLDFGYIGRLYLAGAAPAAVAATPTPSPPTPVPPVPARPAPVAVVAPPVPAQRPSAGVPKQTALVEPPRDVPKAADVEALKWKLQTAFPAEADVFSEAATEFIGRLDRMSSGKLKPEHFVAGQVVPAFEVANAVSQGVIDAGWTHMAYHGRKAPAATLMSGGFPLGVDAKGFVRWATSGAGQRARDAVFAQLDLKGMPCAVVGPHGLWLNKKVTTASRFKGLKIRISGIQVKAAQALGISAVLLPGGEVYAALERGTIDGAVFGTPLFDQRLGYQKVAKQFMYPAFDASSARILDLIVNRTVWNTLGRSSQALIETACRDQLLATLLEVPKREELGLKLLAEAGVEVVEVPADAVGKARVAMRSEAEKIAAGSSEARRLWDSLKDFK